jgi:hypothetical protein
MGQRSQSAMFTIDLNDPHQFTRENVAKLIGSQLDTQNWQLRVTKQGIAYLSSITGSRDIDALAFRFETWGFGNNYVGFQAAHDERWVNQVFEDLTENWPSPKDSLIDF